jgi:hypothetical protein
MGRFSLKWCALMLFVMMGATSAQVRVVRKVDELAQAIEQGVQHIVIVEHLDLTNHPTAPTIGGGNVLFSPQVSTKSITVRKLCLQQLIVRTAVPPDLVNHDGVVPPVVCRGHLCGVGVICVAQAHGNTYLAPFMRNDAE